MKVIVKGTFAYNHRVLMQKCGFAPSKNREGEESFVRALGVGGYPRFHVYLDSVDEGLIFKLHLDQKKPTYGEGTAHSGEYEGEVVEKEAARIYHILSGLVR